MVIDYFLIHKYNQFSLFTTHKAMSKYIDFLFVLPIFVPTILMFGLNHMTPGILIIDIMNTHHLVTDIMYHLLLVYIIRYNVHW